jgi:hypothetical protein
VRSFTAFSGLLVVAATLPLSAVDVKSIVVKSSSTAKGIVMVEAELAGKAAELECFVGQTLCSALASGEYVMGRANASEGIYNDCTNVVIYKPTSSEAKEKLGVYCWLTSGDSYTPMQIETVKAHQYMAKGFHPIDCFAGQIRIRGKRLSRQAFTLFQPNAEMKWMPTATS